MHKKFHLFHMVEVSPWPLLSSMGIWLLTMSMIYSMLMNSMSMLYFSIFMMTLISFKWWDNVVKETLMQGMHHTKVMNGLKISMILFIMSEIFFFGGFFWSYFHSSLSPSIVFDQTWPPYAINSFDPVNIPLLNTIILISSGISITWCHHNLLLDQKKKSMNSLMITIILGIYFSLLQLMEYNQSEFTLADSVYGSTFFMMTGFHGLHVVIGTAFLAVTFFRMVKNQFNSNHFIGFELAAWYWHFVDVIWLMLYLSVYWWGGM